jgi:Site-specific DNA methylase
MEIKAQIIKGISYKPILECRLTEISPDDIKDGLPKMMLYTNLENVTIEGKTLTSSPVLRLTSAKLNGGISSRSSVEARDEFFKTNSFSRRQKEFTNALFAEVLKRCPHRWLLTYDDSPYVRELFKFANIADWKQTYGMRNVSESSQQKETELFISNYEFDFAESKQIAFSFT